MTREEILRVLAEIQEPFSFSVDRPAMLARRKKNLGSTDWAALLEMHPFRKGLEVVADKRSPVDTSDKGSLIMEVGSAQEGFIRVKFYDPNRDDSGAHLYGVEPLVEASLDRWESGPFNLIPHKEHKWLATNVDDLAMSRFGSCAVEIKNVGSFAVKDWRGSEPPHYHWVQCQAHMCVLESHFGGEEFDHCFLVGKLNDREMKVFLIQRDDEFIKSAVDVLGNKWRMIQDGSADLLWALDGSEKTIDALKSMYPGVKDEEAYLNNLEPDVVAYTDKLRELKSLEQEVRELRARIMLGMGDATKAVSGMFKISYPVISGRAKIDAKSAQEAHPEIPWENFMKPGKTYRGGLRITKSKK